MRVRSRIGWSRSGCAATFIRSTRAKGAFRISLTYDAPAAIGKTTAHTDTHHGHFVKLVMNEKIVEVVEFETDAAPGIPPADNEAGWRSSLSKLAEFVEAGR